ncbi:gluconokinase [Microbacterium sp. SA39]|uniref:gluconokinase n=1 Tax=Microbacterium sp. SA39 TaxID=1263625 RepID=UPI00061E14CE|nr:gluconokinase [Microbacterium sp. SA39]KJQ55656.1 Thermoresistant gluconokinase [Microbacterium sp. SA39]
MTDARPLSTAETPIVVMGVSGVGKTTIGVQLAARLGVDFVDADDLHGPENIAKMSAGIPLVDADRWPWLDLVGAALIAEPGAVVACSALRRSYRDRLRATAPETLFVHLAAAPERVALQAEARAGHFMPPALLQSQIATLEPLEPDERGITVIVDAGPEELVDRIVHSLAGEREGSEK